MRNLENFGVQGMKNQELIYVVGGSAPSAPGWWPWVTIAIAAGEFLHGLNDGIQDSSNENCNNYVHC